MYHVYLEDSGSETQWAVTIKSPPIVLDESRGNPRDGATGSPVPIIFSENDLSFIYQHF